jgi:copper homeostasis protein (lipoprotein)
MVIRLPPFALLLGALAAVLALTIAGCVALPASEPVKTAAAVPLLNTHWRLTHLGGQVVTSTGANAAGLQLDAQNPRVSGSGGCNRMFGGYLLNGAQLKFDQIGATKMACLEEARMKLEQDYFQRLSQVAGWKISGSTLELLDAGGASLATFAASPAEQ